jgi:protein TonB
MIGQYARALTLVAVVAASSPADAASAHPSPATPSGHPGEWASDNDYPTAALRDNVQGDVRFVLTIGADGVPTQCEISASSGNADLDGTTCTLMLQRARFNPATDANGRPTHGTYTSSVRWRIPDEGKAALPPPGSETVEYDVLPDGSVANCTVSFSGEIAKYMVKSAAAARCASEGPFAPVTDNHGKPVKKHVVRTETSVVTEVP